MRRYVSFFLGLLVLAGCGESPETTPLDVSPETDPGFPSAGQITDGRNGEGANPYFFFLSPVAESSPQTTGIHDDDLKPIVTICHLVVEGENRYCDTVTDPLVVFDTEVSLTPGSKYGVVWKTNDHPVDPLETFRILVSLEVPPISGLTEQAETVVLGWADVKAYDNQTYSSFQHTDPEGFIAISDNGNLNINFRIEEGALESQYCDAIGVEDCDVELFYPQETDPRCLEVYEAPGSGSEILGSEACLPPNAARDENGDPLQEAYAVVLTLEKSGVPQGGSIDPSQQYPYFPDVKTFPDGLSFDPGVGGIQLTICQVESAFSGQEDLLLDLRPFLVLTTPTGLKQTILPDDYWIDPSACEDTQTIDGTTAAASPPSGLMGYLAAGVSRVTRILRPQPLVARRLHGGLNTTVYDTRGSDSGETENVAAFAGDGAFALGGEEYKVEAGAALDVDPEASEASVPSDGLMLSETAFTITPRNAKGEILSFDVDVTWWIAAESANPLGSAEEPLVAKDGDNDGIYEARYTPQVPGTDYIYVAIDGELLNGGNPFVHEVAPLSGPIEVYVTIPSNPDDEDHDPAVGLPVKLYDSDGNVKTATTEEVPGTWGVGVATFGDELFGNYVVYLPKRDFDFEFEKDVEGQEIYQQDLDHQPRTGYTSVVEFHASLIPLPDGVHVYRIGAGGTGNAYEFVMDNRSWISAQNQIRDVELEGAPAHLATIKSAGENAFLASLVYAQCPDPTRERKCSQAWIGLTDEVEEGTWVWVNDEGVLDPSVFAGWKGDEPTNRNNEDQVEIDLNGGWSDENGASSTNDGYLTEYDAWQPPADPTPPGS